MVALDPGQAEEAFFQNRIALIPKCEGETEPLLKVGNSADAILAPAIRAGARMVMRKIIPSLTGRAVIFAHSAPCSLAQVRSPKIPAFSEALILRDTSLLSFHATAVQSYLASEAKLFLCEANRTRKLKI